MAELVPIEVWGKDHWSTFAYAVHQVFNYKGTLDFRRMRREGDKYPTIIKGGEVSGHNDYDCLWDLEHYGFIENKGTGLNPIIKLTDKGLEAHKQLLLHKQEGKNYQTFVFVDGD